MEVENNGRDVASTSHCSNYKMTGLNMDKLIGNQAALRKSPAAQDAFVSIS